MARYFLDRDGDSHWYIVEATSRGEWATWLNLDQDSEEAWDVPDFAQRLPGGPYEVTFENPEGHEWPTIPQYQE